jgi:hypothetical protein
MVNLLGIGKGVCPLDGPFHLPTGYVDFSFLLAIDTHVGLR